ncbi:hypothetical protein GCM10025868_27200 [Angustibacter aerolatus]|uniref:ANTAR domain-containing protein n=1 Tax=Angustibacter aerolatus TaxID=1162965 RepID=A0ABQ6JJQ4_9ACTN|nr:ANTAR domain-containing protein [Angustibacter aerolatus]GMA87470.1 hypothetical protein GCM10025868_27200 [Angustibacter aerolatus]
MAEQTVADGQTPDREQRILDLEGKVANLERALESRGEIGQAIGILMAMQQATSEQAWELLSSTSQDRNVGSPSLARLVNEQGGIPPA